MNEVAVFLAGVFLCNCIPHLAAGLQGNPFPSPFAKPRGVGDSSPLVNVLWGLVNGLIGIYLLSRRPVDGDFLVQLLIAGAGALVIGVYLAVHFGKVQAARQS